MTDSTNTFADVPLFEGRLPFLAVPSIVILAVAIKHRPRKPLFAFPSDPGKANEFKIAVWALAILQVINIVCAFWTYTHRDGPALTPSLPASAAAAHGALSAMASLLLAAVLALYCQLGIAGIFFRLFPGQSRKLVASLVTLAISPLCWMLGSAVTFSVKWQDRTAIEELEWLMLAQVPMIAFDALLSLALYRLRHEVPGAKRPQAAKLYPVAYWSMFASCFLANLRGFARFLGLSYGGWLWYTLEIGGYLSAAQMHLISLFLVWRVAEPRGSFGDDPIDLDDDGTTMSKDRVPMKDV